MDNGDKINRMKKIKKAILPVAGLGTRFLPATKATPKEMLSIIDKPLVQYAVEEAIEIGIEEIIFITSPSKHSIKKHFDKTYAAVGAPGKWHCIVGTDFGSYVTHESQNFVFFQLGAYFVLVFKA